MIAESEPVEDPLGYDVDLQSENDEAESVDSELLSAEGVDDGTAATTVGDEDIDISNADVIHPSSMAVTLCARLDADGALIVRLPRARRFRWQPAEDEPFEVNGLYSTRSLTTNSSSMPSAWCREPAVPTKCSVTFGIGELARGKVAKRDVLLARDSRLKLVVECVARIQANGTFVITAVLRNVTRASSRKEAEPGSLYQAHFEVEIQGGSLVAYPENPIPFDRLDADEQSLALLYRDSKTWAVGHGCAAGWDLPANGGSATSVYADAMPVVELPSMTPDVIQVDGTLLRLSMRELADLDEHQTNHGWTSLQRLVEAYAGWIEDQQGRLADMQSGNLRAVGQGHLERCGAVLDRMRRGLELLRTDPKVRAAFRLANAAMLLQQVATKQLKPRSMVSRGPGARPAPSSPHVSPLQIWLDAREADGVGHWRAFQAGFLLMSLEGSTNSQSIDRDIVDLIWFPTGGGKTEAYLGVMAVYMFHQRLQMHPNATNELPGDGTNVLMRYTLRMLTTQQFQRGASLICAMEMLRRGGFHHEFSAIPGGRFSLGLWLGGEGSPNSIQSAVDQVKEFKEGRVGNPMVLTECPWCRAAIGLVGDRQGRTGRGKKKLEVTGIMVLGAEGPLLYCPDSQCAFGGPETKNRDWLPVEVIDERIYHNPPSLVIATADKFAMMAYRPEAGALLGREAVGGSRRLVRQPPGMIIQDELHLIAGPLGTIYGLYETVIEDLCNFEQSAGPVRPKRIASTATIRGAAEQVKSIYGCGISGGAVPRLQLFPSPGLGMEDSFFGRYAKGADGTLLPGRLYMGIHGNEYGSVLTTQVRSFSRVLTAVSQLPEAERDPWWTLLAFYNSIRELGGAHTLVQSDIRARTKFLAERIGISAAHRRDIKQPKELTSRDTQSEIVGMLDDLAVAYQPVRNQAIDICLASNIIEVGVDIDRLSLMAVVGQPKTTAQYIQVSGRVGRRWKERPGLVLTLYNPMRSRDRSHYEQFHSYHNRLYEKVEPTTTTPFSRTAIERAAAGAAILWARQHIDEKRPVREHLEPSLLAAFALLEARCREVEGAESVNASVEQLSVTCADLIRKLGANPQMWEEFPPKSDGEYLMLWPGQAYKPIQRHNGVVVPSSMRQVDRSAELDVTDKYSLGTMGLMGDTA